MTRSVEDRVAALEAQNRRLRRSHAFVVGAAGIVLATGALGLARREPVPRDLQAQSFSLVDDAGRTVASLSNTDKGARLRFFDEKSKVRALVGFDPNKGPAVIIQDDNEYPRVLLGVSSDGAGLQINDAGNKKRVSVAQCADCASVQIQDDAGQDRASIGYKAKMSSVSVSDGPGGPSAWIVASTRKTGMAISDAGRVERFQLSVSSTGEDLEMSDPKGRPRVMLGRRREQSALSLFGADGSDIVTLAQHQGGSGLFVSDSDHPHWITLATGDNSASLQLYGKSKNPLVSAWVMDELPTISVWDPAGQFGASMMVHDDHSAIVAYNPAPGAVAWIDGSKEGGELALYDKEGRHQTYRPSIEREPRPAAYLPKAAEPKPAIDAAKPDPRHLDIKPEDGKLDLGPGNLSDHKPR